MKKNKLLIILTGITLGLIVLFVVGKKNGWFSRSFSRSVTVETVKKRTLEETIEANGKVQPETEVIISPDVPGEITAIFVKEGDIVKKGDVLVKIDPGVYLARREKLVAEVNSSKANLSGARARLAQVKAKLINTEANYKRNKKLHSQGAIAEAEYENARTAYMTALAEAEAAEQDVLASLYQVKNTEAALKEANENLGRVMILAPVDGIVSMIKAEAGEKVTGTSLVAGTELLRIISLDAMEVKAEIKEDDISRISIGDTASIRIDAFLDREFKGVVTSVANSARTDGDGLEQLTTFEVKIFILPSSYSDLADPARPRLSPFLSGMSAAVEIKTHAAVNAVSIPSSALTIKEENGSESDPAREIKKEQFQSVFVFDNGIARLTKVKTGIKDGDYIEILSGLNDNQQVITGPRMAISQLKDKDKVTKRTVKTNGPGKLYW